MTNNSKILIVDDDELTIGIISNILNFHNYNTDFCFSGEEALEKIAQSDFDLVLLDVQMGKGLDGYATCKLILEQKPEIPIILVTANQCDESVNKGFESGSRDYIKKPVTKLELLARVNNTIKLKDAEKRNLQLIKTLRKDFITAANIQKSILPKWVNIDGDLVFSSYYEASEAIGGDLFDWIKLDKSKYLVYVGDVSGHGVQAALLMTAIKSNIKHISETFDVNNNLAGFITKLNERLCSDQLMSNNYLTLLIGVVDLDKNEFRFLNAGHPPLVIVNTEKKSISILNETGSIPLCWLADAVYKNADIVTVELNIDDIFILFTDGIYECTDQSETQFGIEGLKELLLNQIDSITCINTPHQIKHYLMTNHYQTSLDDFTLFSFQIHNADKPVFSHLGTKKKYSNYCSILLKHALKDIEGTARNCGLIVFNWTGNKPMTKRIELIISEYLNNVLMGAYLIKKDTETVIEIQITNSGLSVSFWDIGINWVPRDLKYNSDNPYNFNNVGLISSEQGMSKIMSICRNFTRTRYCDLSETRMELNYD